jgi:hypothetical protein
MNIYALDPFTSPTRTLGEAGAGEGQPWIEQGACENYLKLVETYTRLSNKADKSKDTRERAAQYAAGNQVYYNQCLERKAQGAVQAMLQPQGVTPAPSTTNTPTVAVPTGSSTSLAVPTAPVGLPPVGESWFAANKILLIGGGVVVLGIVAYMMMRKKD